MSESDLKIFKADYKNLKHRKAIPFLLNEYAKDLLGYNKELPPHVLKALVSELELFPNGIVVLAQKSEEIIGMAILFLSLSTFNAKPLLNIHDLMVLKKERFNGVGRKILQKIEEIAVEKGCCKITLETQENNEISKHLYMSFGFKDSFLEADAGRQLFFTKEIKSAYKGCLEHQK